MSVRFDMIYVVVVAGAFAAGFASLLLDKIVLVCLGLGWWTIVVIVCTLLLLL